MRRREVAICVLFIIGTIVGCGDTRRSQAIEMCKEMLRESEAPGNWEDVDRSGVDLRGGDYWWNYPGVSVIHQISPEATWKIDFWRWPVSQADRMNGVEWSRYSGRQKARMKLGGFVGEAVCKGPLRPFLPLLLIGEIVHVGKACIFGNGKYLVVGKKSSGGSHSSPPSGGFGSG